jgi:hypothetical protein
MDHKWQQLILVVNFLFGLRVNEIPNMTFILDSHRPFICSAIYSKGFFSGRELLQRQVALHVVGPHLDTRIFEAVSLGGATLFRVKGTKDIVTLSLYIFFLELSTRILSSDTTLSRMSLGKYVLYFVSCCRIQSFSKWEDLINIRRCPHISV